MGVVIEMCIKCPRGPTCKNISYVTVMPEFQAITYPVKVPGRVGAKILGRTGEAA